MPIVDYNESVPSAFKGECNAHPVAASWRSVLAEIVRAFVQGDYALSAPVTGVEPVPYELSEQIKAYVLDYGATLIELPNQTWETSCAQWMGGYWNVLVDLWTREEGRSDLVLEVKVVECGDDYSFRVYLVYVP